MQIVVPLKKYIQQMKISNKQESEIFSEKKTYRWNYGPLVVLDLVLSPNQYQKILLTEKVLSVSVLMLRQLNYSCIVWAQ